MYLLGHINNKNALAWTSACCLGLKGVVWLKIEFDFLYGCLKYSFSVKSSVFKLGQNSAISIVLFKSRHDSFSRWGNLVFWRWETGTVREITPTRMRRQHSVTSLLKKQKKTRNIRVAMRDFVIRWKTCLFTFYGYEQWRFCYQDHHRQLEAGSPTLAKSAFPSFCPSTAHTPILPLSVLPTGGTQVQWKLGSLDRSEHACGSSNEHGAKHVSWFVQLPL